MLYVYDFNVTVKKYLHVLVLDYIAVAVSGKVGPVKPVNHTSWVTVVTPTDRPKSVRNRRVIKLFGDVLVLSRCPFDIGASVIGLIQISSFFSLLLYPWHLTRKITRDICETHAHSPNIFNRLDLDLLTAL